MKFFRLEDSERMGVYSSRKTRDILAGGTAFNSPAANNRHPMPCQDSQLTDNARAYGTESSMEMMVSGRYRFGFLSIKQLRSWFYEDDILLQLGEKGIELTVYEVPEVIEGSAQATMLGKYHNDKHISCQVQLRYLVAHKFNLEKALLFQSGAPIV